MENNIMEVVAVNDVTDSANLAHLLKYDTVQGQYPGTIEHNGDHILVDGKKVDAKVDANTEDGKKKKKKVDEEDEEEEEEVSESVITESEDKVEDISDSSRFF